MSKFIKQFITDVNDRYVEKLAGSLADYRKVFGKEPSVENIFRQILESSKYDKLEQPNKVVATKVPVTRNSKKYQKFKDIFLNKVIDPENILKIPENSPVSANISNVGRIPGKTLKRENIVDTRDSDRAYLDALFSFSNEGDEKFLRNILRKTEGKNRENLSDEELARFKNMFNSYIAPGKDIFMQMQTDEAFPNIISVQEMLQGLGPRGKHLFSRVGGETDAAITATGAPLKTFFAPPKPDVLLSNLRVNPLYSFLQPSNNEILGLIDSSRAKSDMDPLSHFKNFATTTHEVVPDLQGRLRGLTYRYAPNAHEAVADNKDLQKSFNSKNLMFFRKVRGPGSNDPIGYNLVRPKMFDENISMPADKVGVTYTDNALIDSDWIPEKEINATKNPALNTIDNNTDFRKAMIDMARRLTTNGTTIYPGAEYGAAPFYQIGGHIPQDQRINYR